MSIRIDTQFINRLSGQLDNFSQKKPTLFNCRCPICGDSQKSKSKARGYFYAKKGGMYFKCHNCGFGGSVGTVIKEIDSELYHEYRMERWKSGDRQFSKVKKPIVQYNYDAPVFRKRSKLEIPIGTLDNSHPAVSYLRDRGLSKISAFSWCDDFAEYIQDVLPNKYGDALLDMVRDDGRILIPFCNKKGQLTHMQGRTIKRVEHNVRYITLGFIEEPKVFGLDKIDFDRTIYVVEGPFDSTFLPNCIAMGGGDCESLPSIVPIDKTVVVMDNEPRNRDTIRRMVRYIEMGFPISIFPEKILHKDINDIFLSGMNTDDILEIININTYQGIGANLRLKEWAKVKF
ncbi:DNA primase [archaeon]|nr:DNA primase [archaeon]|tara:strand:- start:820 stop:1851 length:1032 start_codon:yes stop_codon:yes gene_type:complete